MFIIAVGSFLRHEFTRMVQLFVVDPLILSAGMVIFPLIIIFLNGKMRRKFISPFKIFADKLFFRSSVHQSPTTIFSLA